MTLPTSVYRIDAGDVIRFVPPFVITEQQIDDGLQRLRAVLTQFPQTQNP